MSSKKGVIREQSNVHSHENNANANVTLQFDVGEIDWMRRIENKSASACVVLVNFESVRSSIILEY